MLIVDACCLPNVACCVFRSYLTKDIEKDIAALL
jgi:hypothetical protein